MPSEFLNELLCPECGGSLLANWSGGEDCLSCEGCASIFPVVDGIPRLLVRSMREALAGRRVVGVGAGVDARKVATAESFGYEWNRFSEMRDEWERNFLEYMQPRGPEFFRGKRVLDAGCGSGRHSFYAARFGADVWAVDLGPAVEAARRNNSDNGARIVQADIYNLPFAPESFDFIYSNGVLHHLPDPEGAFRNLLRYLKPGGEIQIFLYWKPEGQPLKRAMLAGVDLFRRVTTRLPHGAIYALSYPMAWLAFAGFVWPYKIMSGVPGLKALAERLPMKQYARYPFRVCVNDQLDRFSAPIENRYTRAEVEGWLARAGLESVSVRPNFGWNATGRKPAFASARG